MPISCHFRDCTALLFESRKQRYNKYPDLYGPLTTLNPRAYIVHSGRAICAHLCTSPTRTQRRSRWICKKIKVFFCIFWRGGLGLGCACQLQTVYMSGSESYLPRTTARVCPWTWSPGNARPQTACAYRTSKPYLRHCTCPPCLGHGGSWD